MPKNGLSPCGRETEKNVTEKASKIGVGILFFQRYSDRDRIMKHVYDIKIGSIRRIQETGNCRILQPRYRLESPGRQCAECTGEFPGFFLTPDRRQRLAALYEFQCIEATDRHSGTNWDNVISSVAARTSQNRY